MGARQAQEFWDRMWQWERYEKYPAEPIDDPHLVIILGSQVAAVRAAGQQVDPELTERFDHCAGRVLMRLTDLLPRSGEQPDLDEFGGWLRFGLDPTVRGHDGVPVPIIDADSLVNFLRFTRSAIEYCNRHALDDLGSLWTTIQQMAQEIDDQHGARRRPSRFDPPPS